MDTEKLKIANEDGKPSERWLRYVLSIETKMQRKDY
jgi:hypothetical protein